MERGCESGGIDNQLMEKVMEVRRERGGVSRVVIGSVERWLNELLPEGRIIVVADANVDRHFGKLVERFDHIIIGQGESNKTLRTVEDIIRQLIEREADRDTFLLGIGGGIVTDITGFVASIYMRGVGFGFIPTTLLAQVDASVGGKNGVNLDGYKNMVGLFNQPDFVICDPQMLCTLPDREFRAGLAEVIKAAVIGDKELFELFEEHCFEDFRTDSSLLHRAICGAVAVKAEIVERDEREAGERRKLNLGHTIGHAIEKCSHDFLHGEAVAIGMAYVAQMAAEAGELSVGDAERIRSVINRYGLPVELPVELRRLRQAIMRDKKRAGDEIAVVMPAAIGRCVVRKIPVESAFVE